MIKIIGIDPGLADTGIGLVQGEGTRLSGYSYGCIKTSSQDKTPTRLDCIYTKISKLLADEKPDLMVVEDVFSLHKYPKSGIDLGKVTGVILLAGNRAGVPVTELAVREAKKILTGSGNADKQQLERAVRRIICAPEPIRPFHASDAIGLAVIGLYRYDRLYRG
ncbi:MAG: crossover junction endodeoxyribonuclease RuvC [Desulfobacterales bacterium]|nr:crossover junction endodeoxyribonuclease RuvC [Desulfobacterales bacterium]